MTLYVYDVVLIKYDYFFLENLSRYYKNSIFIHLVIGGILFILKKQKPFFRMYSLKKGL